MVAGLSLQYEDRLDEEVLGESSCDAVGIVEYLAQPKPNLLRLVCTGKALQLGDVDRCGITASFPSGVESRHARYRPTDHDSRFGEMLAERQDQRFVSGRASVQSSQVETEFDCDMGWCPVRLDAVAEDRMRSFGGRVPLCYFDCFSIDRICLKAGRGCISQKQGDSSAVDEADMVSCGSLVIDEYDLLATLEYRVDDMLG
jgi:hypothetical protein